MLSLNVLGIFFCVGAGVIVLFETIRSMMTAGEVVVKMSSLAEIVGEAHFAWIDRIPMLWIQNGLHFLVNLPAWTLVLALGILCFIIAGIRNR